MLPFALLACACGAAALRPSAPAKPVSSAPKAAAPSTAAFASLAAEALTAAPGMREVARVEGDGGPAELLRTVQRDACVRVAYEADAPVRAELVDQGGRVLAEAADDAEPAKKGGVLGAAGPVCVRKGDSVTGVVVGGTAGHVRWMAWEAL